MKMIRVNNRGITIVELVVTMAILTILASLILPSAQMTARRVKEIELRRNLRIIRTAIDDFKKYYDKAIFDKKIMDVVNKSGYPESLQLLVDGYDFGGALKEKKKFLRRIPTDPFTPSKPGEEPEWGLRAYADEPDTTTWGGEDVYDVYSLSEGTAIDGTKYKEW
ncbi:MAG: hypothetical protein FD174_3050 [Geobacteraceae bacterium]|nr:MAG: hypothetical protein FD174_3050 [Geobacteraceae bacterium]